MNKFLPSRDEINPNWFERWGETFEAPQLALQMMSNDRLFVSMRGRMFTAFGIDPNAKIKPEDIASAQTYGIDRDRLARICGMVMHGDFLRTRTSKPEFEIISQAFSIEDLKIAVSLNHLHPKQSEFAADMDKIETLIVRCGKACIHSWKTSLDEQIGMRVYLMETNEEQEEEVTHTIESAKAREIVIAVSTAILNENSSLAA